MEPTNSQNTSSCTSSSSINRSSSSSSSFSGTSRSSLPHSLSPRRPSPSPTSTPSPSFTPPSSHRSGVSTVAPSNSPATDVDTFGSNIGVGIDVGTRCIRASWYSTSIGGVEIIPLGVRNESSLPVAIYFPSDGGEPIIGERAMEHLVIEPTQVVVEPKRFVEKKFNSSSPSSSSSSASPHSVSSVSSSLPTLSLSPTALHHSTHRCPAQIGPSRSPSPLIPSDADGPFFSTSPLVSSSSAVFPAFPSDSSVPSSDPINGYWVSLQFGSSVRQVPIEQMIVILLSHVKRQAQHFIANRIRNSNRTVMASVPSAPSSSASSSRSLNSLPSTTASSSSIEAVAPLVSPLSAVSLELVTIGRFVGQQTDLDAGVDIDVDDEIELDVDDSNCTRSRNRGEQIGTHGFVPPSVPVPVPASVPVIPPIPAPPPQSHSHFRQHPPSLPSQSRVNAFSIGLDPDSDRMEPEIVDLNLSCVLSVPSCFSAEGRQLISRAATKAGWTVLRLIHEATAAALALLVQSNTDRKQVGHVGAGSDAFTLESRPASSMSMFTSNSLPVSSASTSPSPTAGLQSDPGSIENVQSGSKFTAWPHPWATQPLPRRVLSNTSSPPVADSFSQHDIAFSDAITQSSDASTHGLSVLSQPVPQTSFERNRSAKNEEAPAPSSSSSSSSPSPSSSAHQHFLVVDFGGAYCDASVLSIQVGVICVLSDVSVDNLGGSDLTDRLVQYCCQDFSRQYPNATFPSPYAMQRLRFSCESARHELSNHSETTIHIPLFYDHLDYTCHLTRHVLDVLCADLYKRVVDCVRVVLEEAKLEVEQISQLLLIGGAMRTATLRRLLVESFRQSRLSEYIPTDQVVADGSAIQASIELGTANEQIKRLWLEDVSHLSLGIDTAGDLMHVLIQRNTPLPCRGLATFSTYLHNQTAVTIHLYEGERARTTDNRLIATLELKGITPAPRGVPIIQVTVAVDRYGILTLTAEEVSPQQRHKASNHHRSSGIESASSAIGSDADSVRAKSQLTVHRSWYGLPPTAQHHLIHHILSDADQHRQDDQQHQERIEAKNRLEQYLNGLKTLLEYCTLGSSPNNLPPPSLLFRASQPSLSTAPQLQTQNATQSQGQGQDLSTSGITSLASSVSSSSRGSKSSSLSDSASLKSSSTSSSASNWCDLSDMEVRLVIEVCDHVSAWLSANEHAQTRHYQRKLMEMELVCQTILKKIYTNTATKPNNK